MVRDVKRESQPVPSLTRQSLFHPPRNPIKPSKDIIARHTNEVAMSHKAPFSLGSDELGCPMVRLGQFSFAPCVPRLWCGDGGR